MFFNFKPSKAAPVFPPKSWVRDDDNPSLLELVLKFVFCETLPFTEPEKYRNFTLKEEQLMKFSIDWWYKQVEKRKYDRIVKFKIYPGDEIDEFGSDEIEYQLMQFASLIRKKEQKDASLMRRIAIWKRDRTIDYRKVYNLPASKTESDYEMARIALERWNTKNPELN